MLSPELKLEQVAQNQQVVVPCHLCPRVSSIHRLAKVSTSLPSGTPLVPFYFQTWFSSFFLILCTLRGPLKSYPFPYIKLGFLGLSHVLVFSVFISFFFLLSIIMQLFKFVFSIGSVFLPLIASKLDFNSSVALCCFYIFFPLKSYSYCFTFRLFSSYRCLFLFHREFAFCHAIKIAKTFISIKYQISKIF